MTHRRQEIEAFVRNLVVEVEVAEAEGIATPEAIAVSHLDDMDAKLQMVIAAADRERFAQCSATESAFTDKIWALETQIYRPDPTTLGQ